MKLARAAKTLLSSITRVLLLADTVIVKQLLGPNKDHQSAGLHQHQTSLGLQMQAAGMHHLQGCPGNPGSLNELNINSSALDALNTAALTDVGGLLPLSPHDPLQSVTNFIDFVKAFSQFGADMMELIQVISDRQAVSRDVFVVVVVPVVCE